MTMTIMRVFVTFSLFLPTFLSGVQAQDSLAVFDQILGKPEVYISNIQKKSEALEESIYLESEKLLTKLKNQEKRLRRKLVKKDSLAAFAAFGNIESDYDELLGKLKSGKIWSSGNKIYNTYLDTISTSLKFLQAKSLVTNPKIAVMAGKVREDVKKFESALGQAQQIRSFIRDRKQAIKAALEKHGLSQSLKKYNKQVYYYSMQVKEYKEAFKDPGKMERKAWSTIQKLPAFKSFFQKYSELTSIFPEPDNLGDVSLLAGLQTRATVQQAIQSQIGSANPAIGNMVHQNLQTAKSDFERLKDEVTKAGGYNSGDEIPDFKPNNQKLRPFWERLELGTNLQTTKSSLFFPTTTDIGISVGYHVNDEASFGVGGSYKLGLGKDIRHIVFTHEGIGLRTFLDWKLVNTFYLSGGYEKNFRRTFHDFQVLKNNSLWQESGLVGISKIVSVNSNFFKRTKVQVMWDFLSRRQTIPTQSILFRVGYGIN